MTTASPKNLGAVLQDVTHYCLAVMRNPPKESAFAVGRDGSRDYLTYCAFSRASEIRLALKAHMKAYSYLETATIGTLFKAAVACADANGLDWYTGERPEPTAAPAEPTAAPLMHWRNGRDSRACDGSSASPAFATRVASLVTCPRCIARMPVRPLASLKVGDALNAAEVAAYWNGRPGWAEGVYAYDGTHSDGSCGWKVVETRASKPSWVF